MTLLADLNAIGNVTVGASPAYPVVSARCTTRRVGADGQNVEAYREEEWELTCHAFAATPGDIGTVEETIRTDLVRRGQVVTFTDKGVARTMPAGGAVGGSLVGYPIVQLADDPTKSFGTIVTFTIRATTRIPNAAVDLVEHDYERTEATDEDGLVSITQRGSVRTKNGVAARAHAQTAFVTPEETAAGVAGQDFLVRWTETADTTLVRYEFTRRDQDDNGGTPGVTEAQVTDRTVKQLDGRRVRTVSGYAIGASADTFADAQKPATDPSNILVREERTPATVPDGRVNFSYEVLTGVTDLQFPGLVIFRFNETIEEVSGGKGVLAQSYFLSTPSLRRGRQQPHVYRQVTEVEFIGAWPISWTGTGVEPQMATDNLLTDPRYFKRGGSNGLRQVRLVAEFIFQSAQSVPNPREIEGLA